MNDDLVQVTAALRAAGWRSSEQRLHLTAIKRLATVRWHQEQAAGYRASAARMSDEVPEARRRFLRAALRHEVRAVERGGAVTRAVRQVALRLLPTWAGDDAQQLLDVAAAIAEASAASQPAVAAAGLPSAGSGMPDLRQALAP